VKVCDTYGKGYFYIPGTDTCLKISGLVRMDARFEEDDATIDESGNDFVTDVRGRLQVDARSETEWGTVRSFIEFEGRSDSTNGNSSADSDYSGGAQSVIVRQAFIQFAGITAGKLSRSLYDFVPYKIIGDAFSDEQVNTLAYTASFGEGFEATVGLEDKYFRARPVVNTFGPGAADDGFALDQTFPNGIAALVIKQAWGDAKISAAIQDNEGDRDVGDDGDSIGWAVQAGLSINLPTTNKGSKVWVQGAYGEGASSYLGGEDFNGNFRNFAIAGALIADQSVTPGGNVENVEAYSVGGGVDYFWSKTVNSHILAFYTDYDRPDAAAGLAGADFEFFFVEANTFWSPVSNLELGLAVQYGNLDIDTTAVTNEGEDDQFAVVGRVARTF
jgi:hypothetical protein